jgi:hypothetical protein
MNITLFTRFIFFKLEGGNRSGKRIFRLNLTLFPLGKHELRLIQISWNNAAMNKALAATQKEN